MAYCINCGKELPDGAKFCTFCGAPQTTISKSTQSHEPAMGQLAANGLESVEEQVVGPSSIPEEEVAPFVQQQQKVYSPQQTSYQPQQEERKHPNLLWSIGAFVGAIVGLFVSGWAGLIISVAVFVLSIIVIVKKGRLYGFAITALVISCLGIIVSTYNVVLTTNLKKLTETTAEAKEEVRRDEEHPDFLVGTYVGEHGCGLTLFPDGATRYYFYTNPDILTEGTWEYADGEVLWHFKGGNALSNCDVTAEIEGEDASELYLQSPSLVWDDEHYKKVSDKTEDYSEADYQAMIREVYPDVLGAEDDSYGFEEVEYAGIIFQVPDIFTYDYASPDGEDKYYYNDGGNITELFFGYKEDLGIPKNTSDEVINRLKNEMFESILSESVTLIKEAEYKVAGLPCDVRDYSLRAPGESASIRLAIIVDVERDMFLVTGIMVQNDKENSPYLDMFDTMMKTATRSDGSRTETGKDYNNSKDSDSGSTYGVDPDLKAYLDSYEAFMDEYIDFMKKYLDDPTNVVSMLDEYSDIMKRMEEFEKQNDAYESSDMSTADMEYFLDVTTRCTKKMLEIYTD